MRPHILNQDLDAHRAVSRLALGRTPAEQRAAAQLRGKIGRRVQLAAMARRYGDGDTAARYTREANGLRSKHAAMVTARAREGGISESQSAQVARHAPAQGAGGPFGAIPGMATQVPPPDWTPGTNLGTGL